jgi:predicted amidohydrolase
MKALMAQLAPIPGDLEANVATVVRLVEEHPDVDLAVFPELFLTGYDPPTVAEWAVPAGTDALSPINDAAAQCRVAVLAGFAETAGGGVANSVACIAEDGTWAGCYRKTHLFGTAEFRAFAAGTHLLVADLGKVRVGPLICFDLEFPEPARALGQAGAELLVTVAANMAPYGPDHQLMARARALENRRPHVYVNRVGNQGEIDFVGGSLAVDGSGQVVAGLGNEPEVVCVELDVHAPIPREVDYLAQLRPKLPVVSGAMAHLQGGLV